MGSSVDIVNKLQEIRHLLKYKTDLDKNEIYQRTYSLCVELLHLMSDDLTASYVLEISQQHVTSLLNLLVSLKDAIQNAREELIGIVYEQLKRIISDVRKKIDGQRNTAEMLGKDSLNFFSDRINFVLRRISLLEEKFKQINNLDKIQQTIDSLSKKTDLAEKFLDSIKTQNNDASKILGEIAVIGISKDFGERASQVRFIVKVWAWLTALGLVISAIWFCFVFSQLYSMTQDTVSSDIYEYTFYIIIGAAKIIPVYFIMRFVTTQYIRERDLLETYKFRCISTATMEYVCGKLLNSNIALTEKDFGTRNDWICYVKEKESERNTVLKEIIKDLYKDVTLNKIQNKTCELISENDIKKIKEIIEISKEITKS